METKATLSSDAKLVYNGTLNDLVALAKKYGVSTNSLGYALAHPSPVFASIGHQAFKTESDKRQIRSLLYATIKSEMRTATN